MPCFGRGDGIRTHDLCVPNATRYQLRYASIFRVSKHTLCSRKRKYYTKYISTCQTFFLKYCKFIKNNFILTPNTTLFSPSLYPVFSFQRIPAPTKLTISHKKSLAPQKVPRLLFFLLLKGLQERRSTSKTKSLRQ